MRQSRFKILFLIGLQAHLVCLQEETNIYDIIKGNKELSDVSFYKFFLHQSLTWIMLNFEFS